MTGYELPTWAALPARPDAAFDELARRVGDELRVPRALVVLVSKGGQVFPGAFGLPEPWAARRSMPLSQSVSLRVATTGTPLVLRDAREDAELGKLEMVHELAVVGYAAMPLEDVHGRPIGALAVSDDRPRDWTGAELSALRRLAAEASSRLQVHALELAEREAQAAAERADDAARKAVLTTHAAVLAAEADADRTRVVARLSAELLPAQTLADLLRSVDRSLRSPLGSAVTLFGLGGTDAPELQVWTTTAGAPPAPRPGARLMLAGEHPLAVAVREHRPVPVAGSADAARFPGPALLPSGTVESALAVPLVLGQHASAAGLLVGWRESRELDLQVRTVVTELAQHVGHALDRVLLRDQRLRLAARRTSPPVAV